MSMSEIMEEKQRLKLEYFNHTSVLRTLYKRRINMREIKFRGKTIQSKKWVYGHYFKTPLTDEETNSKPEDGWYFLSGRIRHCIVRDTWCVYEVDPKTVSEYIGVQDDSDDEIEIYESDIIEFSYEEKTYIGEVKFEAGAFIIVSDQLPDGYITILDIINSDRDYFWIDGKVIGNIYENLDLLNK
jgi:uncharacterized phage protein (TIGR01671 family)